MALISVSARPQNRVSKKFGTYYDKKLFYQLVELRFVPPSLLRLGFFGKFHLFSVKYLKIEEFEYSFIRKSFAIQITS